jgi:hypothetical protein
MKKWTARDEHAKVLEMAKSGHVSNATIVSKTFNITMEGMLKARDDIRQVMIDYNTKPKYFHDLNNSPKLYYQLESDEGVIITGEKIHCVFKLELPDKSVIQGGINPSGNLFGDRKMPTKKSHPLRWFSREEVERGILPPAQRRRKIKLPPGKTIGEKHIQPIGISSDTKLLLDSYQGDQEARNLIKRLEGELQLKDKAYAALRTKLTQIQQKHDAIVSEVNTYRNGMAEAENTAKQEVEKLREEYERRKNTRRWQVEAVKTEEFEVEGMVARSWEIEDEQGELRYLVVTQASSGTSTRVQEQWLTTLRDQVDEEIGGDRVVYVSAPNGCITTVLEILPDFIEEEDEEIGQF